MTVWSRLLSSISLGAALLPAASLAGTASHIVDLGYAQYLGNLSYPDTVAFLGLPYAEPPVGERRFRAPLPLDTARVANETKGQVANATTYPDQCIQGSLGFGDAGGAGTEDCLKVNVYAPADAKEGAKLPVLVYIHGGGFMYGNPSNWPFDNWIHQSPNVVIVSVYYRLNSIGFLSIPEFIDGSLGDLNAGFQDQVLALKWVQKYIHAFGGDPGRVTINGESAGGMSVELHLVAHEGEPLFSQAIGQSVGRIPLPNPEQNVPLFNFYANAAGCGTEDESVADRLACLRRVDVSALAHAQDQVSFGKFTGPYNGFHPVIDGKLITDIPTLSIQRGEFADVPIIVGATSNETVSGGGNFTASLKQFFPGLTDEDLVEYVEHYPLSDFSSEEERFNTATGESELMCPREIIGQAAAPRNKVWTYRYNQPVPTLNTSTVTHASENWMMFNGCSTGVNGSVTFEHQSAADKAFASELIAYWLSFVRSGDPNTHKLPTAPVWPAYTVDRRVRVVLQEPADGSVGVSGTTVEDEPEKESRRCAFVASKAAHQQA
ncbi:alpha/beta-hydrolase [Trametes meyenii]|nr:alpha/beta-hydrolase [Trametes meyenii]